MDKKIKHFIIISLDDVGIAILIIALSYYLAKQYFYLVTAVTLTGLIIFLAIKYILLKPVLENTPISKYDLTNRIGIVIKDLNPRGLVKLGNEVWRAESIHGNSIRKGRKVIVLRRKNFILIVKEME